MAPAQEVKNHERDLAAQIVQLTDESLFLTGKAGTGKTTFLHWVVSNTDKRVAVVAPTGIAALNAGGTTIHSLFQLMPGAHPPVNYVPDALLKLKRCDEQDSSSLSSERIKLIRNLDLLIIDEVSMVRADLLDAVDSVLRQHRDARRPFGGLQLLMIGDLYQLTPVARPDEWGLVSQYYKSPYFFSSYAYWLLQPQMVELKHIYRQRDPAFISILNEVREGKVSQPTLDMLNNRYRPGITQNLPKDTILLSTHNRTVDTINAEQLERLATEPHRYAALVQGSFPKNTYPAPLELELKVGAQVMFCKNDSNSEGVRYFNGQIGRVVELDESSVTVKRSDESEPIRVESATWDNTEPQLNSAGEVVKITLGTFTQMPFRLAWAVTIHKSQGLTFDRTIIDAAQSFSAGQVYVALSRCRTLEGILLCSKLSPEAIITDSAVTNMMEATRSQAIDKTAQQDAICRFNRATLVSLYDFQRELDSLDELSHVLQILRIDLPLYNLCTVVAKQLYKLHRVGAAFVRRDVDKLLRENSDIENNAPLQKRIKDAGIYFTSGLDTEEIKSFLVSMTGSRNAAIIDRYEAKMGELLDALYPHKKLLELSQEGYDTSTFRKMRIKFMLENDDWVKWRALRRKYGFDVDRKIQELTATIEEGLKAQAQWEGESANQIEIREYVRRLVEDCPQALEKLATVRDLVKEYIAAHGTELMALLRKE